MNCKDIEIKIIDFIDKQLSESESKLMQEHIDSCISCKANYEETMVLMGAFKNEEQITPSDDLRKNFLNQLDEEKQLQQTQVVQLNQAPSFNWKQAFQIAASFLLLFLGFFAGNYTSKQKASEEIAVLQEQTIELKENMMLAMMDNRSASKRIQGVQYLDEFSNPDETIVKALVARMLLDENTNVRLTAVNALQAFIASETVKNGFVKALGTEKDPGIQITIIQALVKIQEKKALLPMQRLLENNETQLFVKEEIKSTISNII